MKTKELKITLLVQIPQVSLDTGISENIGSQVFLPSRQQNGKKKKNFSGEPDHLKAEEKCIKSPQ